jgi:hypothetical protein
MVRDDSIFPALPVKLDYSLTGVNATLAVEKGLAEADWYQCAVPRETMRELLERRNGPAIRDTILWFALSRLRGYRHLAALGHVVGDPSLHDLCRALRHQFRFALARMRPRHRVPDRTG